MVDLAALGITPERLQKLSPSELKWLDGATKRMVWLEAKEACEASLPEFIKQSWHVVEPGNPYVQGWHIGAVCKHLEAITNGVEVDGKLFNRLLINLPPGGMKSLLVNVFWPAWEWGPKNLPHLRYVCVSHAQDLSVRDSMRMRRLVMSDWYKERWGKRVSISEDQNQKTKFENTATGFRQAAAAGSITGARGDRVICFPYETKILTSSGWLEIGDVVEKRLNVLVAGYGEDYISWQAIESHEKNPARPLVRVDFGRSVFECTDDHPVFIERQGWVKAADLRPGDCAWFASEKAVRDLLRSAKGAEEKSCEAILLSSMLHGEQAGQQEAEYAAVRDLRSTGIQATGASCEGEGWTVLQRSMHGNLSDRFEQSGMVWREGYAFLQKMWKAVYQEARRVASIKRQLLLTIVQDACRVGYAWAASIRHTLRILRNSVQAREPLHQTVFAGMRRFQTCGAHEGEREWQIPSWSRFTPLPTWMVTRVQGCYPPARSQLLSGLWDWAYSWDNGAACPSYRLRQDKFRQKQPDNRLQDVSRLDAWQTGTAHGMERTIVRSVERSSRRIDATYNVKVGPHHNYFADGILVHNCDDPHSVESGTSDTMRKSTVEWFLEAVPTRVNNPKESAIVVIMQRLHEEDVSGVILSKGLGYEHLCLPMRFEEGRRCETGIGFVDPRGDGDLLFPERFPEEVVARDEEVLGPYAVAGQFQQRPEPRGGGILKTEWWQEWDDEAARIFGVPNAESYPQMELILASVDTAYTTKEENDPSAMTVWGLFRDPITENPQLMLMHAWAKRLELHGPAISQKKHYESDAEYLIRCKAAWGLTEWVMHTCKKNKVDKLLIEAKASGISVYQEIRRLQSLSDWQTSLINPGAQDKVSRAYAVQPIFAAGQIWAPSPSLSWVDIIISQCSSFPKAAHDDLVDSLTQAINWFRVSGLLKRPAEVLAEHQEQERYKKKAPVLYDV